jgi:hypothetical protein
MKNLLVVSFALLVSTQAFAKDPLQCRTHTQWPDGSAEEAMFMVTDDLPALFGGSDYENNTTEYNISADHTQVTLTMSSSEGEKQSQTFEVPLAGNVGIQVNSSFTYTLFCYQN